jgi:hypothetical protein
MGYDLIETVLCISCNVDQSILHTTVAVPLAGTWKELLRNKLSMASSKALRAGAGKL